MRATTVDEVVAQLRAGGSRFTGQRRTILEALFSSDEHHVTAEDVWGRVRQIDPSIHRSSVYRTLDLLVERGVIDEVQPGQRPTVYHLPAAAHVHLVCDGCGAVGEAPLDVLGAAADRLEDEHGFTLRRDGLVLRGRCADCA
jgi:Fur family ferric uptake transcriptional regulator